MAGELSRKQEVRVQVEHCCCWGMAVPQPVVCCGWTPTPDCRLHFLQEVGKVFHRSSRVLGSSRSPGYLWVCRWMGGACLSACHGPHLHATLLNCFHFLSLFALYFST